MDDDVVLTVRTAPSSQRRTCRHELRRRVAEFEPLVPATLAAPVGRLAAAVVDGPTPKPHSARRRCTAWSRLRRSSTSGLPSVAARGSRRTHPTALEETSDEPDTGHGCAADVIPQADRLCRTPHASAKSGSDRDAGRAGPRQLADAAPVVGTGDPAPAWRANQRAGASGQRHDLDRPPRVRTSPPISCRAAVAYATRRMRRWRPSSPSAQAIPCAAFHRPRRHRDRVVRQHAPRRFPCTPMATTATRSAHADGPLAALMAMSEEERIALFS